MHSRNFFVFGLLWLLPAICEAQMEESEAVIESLLESRAENGQTEDDFAELSERLQFLKDHPYDLNKVTAEQLGELVFLTPLQVQNLVRYREENGPFTEIQELQLVELFSWPVIRQLLPFVVIPKAALLARERPKARSRLDWITTYGQVLQAQKGYSTPDSVRGYNGSPSRLVSRLRYSLGNRISAAVTMEKDPGERLSFENKAYGFDFYSANLFIRDGRLVRKLAIGDYSLQFGQGVALWSGLSFGKGATISGIAKVQAGLKPYSSTNEAGFFRGVAATLALRRFEITPFVSYKKIDATTVAGDTLMPAGISAISISGLHRTASELDKKNAEDQLVFGSVAQYENKGFRLGALVSQTRFSKSLQAGNSLYNKFEFAGSVLTNGSLYYNYTWKNTYSFAELAHNVDGGLGMIGGIMGSLSRQVSAIVLYRNYQPDYYSFFSGSVAEGSGVANERGLYSGLNIRLNSKLEWSFYTDVFKFPWMRYRVDAPSHGKEILTQAIWSPNRETKVSIRFRSVSKQQNDAVENAVNYLVEVRKENYRLDLSYRIGRVWTLRNRAELVRYRKDSVNQYGTVLYQDIICKPTRGRLSGNCRLALFDTGGFDSRLYAFENDVLYSYGMSPYQDKGMRAYVNGRYRLGRDIDIWLRFATTVYNGKDEIGTDLDLISGNRKSDVKVQVRYVFR